MPSGLCRKEYAPEDFMKYLEHIDSHAIEEAYGNVFVETQVHRKSVTNFMIDVTISTRLQETRGQTHREFNGTMY